MQWQKVSNVNPPIDEVLLVYSEQDYGDEVCFARRYICDDPNSEYYGVDVVGYHEDFWCLESEIENVNTCTFEEFKRDFANDFWCLFKRPCE